MPVRVQELGPRQNKCHVLSRRFMLFAALLLFMYIIRPSFVSADDNAPAENAVVMEVELDDGPQIVAPSSEEDITEDSSAPSEAPEAETAPGTSEEDLVYGHAIENLSKISRHPEIIRRGRHVISNSAHSPVDSPPNSKSPKASPPNAPYRRDNNDGDIFNLIARGLIQLIHAAGSYMGNEPFSPRNPSTPKSSKELESKKNENIPTWDGLPVVEDGDFQEVIREKAVKMLEILGYERRYPEALYTLGEMQLVGKFGHPRNVTSAVQHFSKLAHDYGHPAGQRMMGFFHATGVGVEKNYGKALLYTSFAAVGRDHVAEMTLGYWNLVGVGMSKNCEDAAWYYRRAADRAIANFRSGPPGGLTMPPSSVNLPDIVAGGVYGSGASGSGQSRDNSHLSGPMTTEEVLDLHKVDADKGDVHAMLRVGASYYTGLQDVPRDYNQAFRYFYRACAVSDSVRIPPPPPTVNGVTQQRDPAAVAAERLAKQVGKSCGLLGRMYFRGEGVQADNATARIYFEKGLKLESDVAMNGLGIMYLDGSAGLNKDVQRAAELFQQAAIMNNGDAQVNMGELLLSLPRPDINRATQYFKLAVRDHILAWYHMGNILTQGLGDTKENCLAGVQYYKFVAERGCWSDPIMQEAYKSYLLEDVEGAFIRYLLAAERGYELGQLNSAWLIDIAAFDANESQFFSNGSDAYETALSLWNRAANQGSVDARVKVGDYYYYGLGTGRANKAEKPSSNDGLDKEPAVRYELSSGGWKQWIPEQIRDMLPKHLLPVARGKPDPERAAMYYLVAAQIDFSAIAMWNLGWMHENGVGVKKDFHLAKRLYDQSLTTNSDAYLPVYLSLTKLAFKRSLAYITGGDGLTPSTTNINNPPAPEAEMKRKKATGKGEAGNSLPGDEMVYDLEDDFADLIETIIVLGLTLTAVLLVWYRRNLNNNWRPPAQAPRRPEPAAPPRENIARAEMAGGAGAGNFVLVDEQAVVETSEPAISSSWETPAGTTEHVDESGAGPSPAEDDGGLRRRVGVEADGD
ncbi:hypothetical protein BJ742DRAFT_906854 [Cladochytrium replicatum]|nr:hypothetical protein BJ742DRAFT_906854 [Cladochytrium replicatum]